MKLRALVVDDNRNNLLLEKDLLEIAGFVVYEAENAYTGVGIAKNEIPDIIVMDARLPDMSGTDAARILRLDKKTCHIPVVFVTASVMAENRDDIKNITNSGFIGKPINTRTFAEEIADFHKISVMNIEKPDSKEVGNEQ